jgi:hypothetical protein
VRANSRVTVSAFAIAAFLFGVASIALGLPFFFKQSAVVRNWPGTTALVRNSEVVQITQGDQKLWATRFELAFEVDGQPVTSTVTGYRQAFTRERAEEAAALFPKGSEAFVRYDPNKPSEVRLDTDKPTRYYQLPIALGTTGVVFIAIALALFYLAKR